MDERERTARALGDIVRGKLAPMVGALAGGTLGIGLSQDGNVRRVVAFARDAWTTGGDPIAALREVPALLAGGMLPILGAAFAGALLFGMLQTRGYLGALAPVQQREVPTPSVPLATVGWCLLGIIVLRGVPLLVELGVSGSPGALVIAATEVARRLGEALLVALAAVALVDHLLRARARAARLGEDRARARPIAPPPISDERVEVLLAGAELVVFDAELALAIGERDGAHVIVARARGLAARALEDAARQRGLRLRAASDLGALEVHALGAPLPAACLSAWGLAARRDAHP